MLEKGSLPSPIFTHSEVAKVTSVYFRCKTYN